jgi:multidrug resistance efflux pump
MSRKWVLPVVALALVGWSVWNVFGAQRPSEAIVRSAPPPGSPAENTVSGAGMVEPRTESSGTATTAVGSELAGVVAQVNVHVGQQVEKGTPLFVLDDRAKQAELQVKQANLHMAEKQLARLEQMPRREEVLPLEAKVRAAQAAETAARDAYEVARRAGSAVPPVELVQMRQALEQASQVRVQAQDQLDLLKAGAWKPDLEVAQATVEQARAAVEQVKTDLKRLVVLAPMTGQVLQVNVRQGEAVSGQPGQALILMGDVSVLHVRVSFDEADISRFQSGAPAVARTRGSPQKTLPLKFVRIEPYVVPKMSLTGDNTERVDTRVMQAIYAIDQPNAPVQLGQQLDVFVDLDSARGHGDAGPKKP